MSITEHVVACLDGATHSAAVCDLAVWAASRLQLPLTLLHVVEKPAQGVVMPDLSGNLGLDTQAALLEELAQLDAERAKVAQAHGREVLLAAKERAREQGLSDVGILQRHGELVETLQGLQNESRIVVMGQHPLPDGGSRISLDLHVEKAVRLLKAAVMVVPAQARVPRKFGIAFDASDTSRLLVERAASSAMLRGLPCLLMMAAQPTPERKIELEWATKTLSDLGFDVSVTVRPGEAEAILREEAVANDLDLIVMGAYGHSRIREWIVGSTTTAMLRKSQVPLLIAR